MACTRLEWSYNISLLKILPCAHSIVVVFAIYIQQGYSTQLTHTISFSLYTKVAKEKVPLGI